MVLIVSELDEIGMRSLQEGAREVAGFITLVAPVPVPTVGLTMTPT